MMRLRVIDAIDLRDDEGRPVDAVLAQPKRLALLVYLALARPHGFHRRDTVLAILWPELNQVRARNALSQALHHIRRAMKADPFVMRGDEEIAVSDAVLECDARQLSDLLDDERADESLAQFNGMLLPGFFVAGAAGFEEWLENERASLRGRAARACGQRSDASLAVGRGDDAARWARQAAMLSPDDEPAHRRLIVALARNGDRTGALRVFDDLTRRLSTEFDAAPSDETQRLVRSIRAGDLVLPPGPAPPPTPEAPPLVHDRERPPTSSPLAADRPSSRRRRGARVAAGVALLLAAAYLSIREARGPSTDQAIAVLPFLDLSADHGEEYLSDGMAEELSDALSHVPGLRVTSRTSAFAFKGKNADAREIGRALGVSSLIEGSVRRENATLRITAQLIDARSGYHRWSRTYERDAADVLAVQEELARAIVGELSSSLGLDAAIPAHLARRATASLDAHTAYLRGRFYWNLRTAAALDTAIALFNQAIRADSMYADAYAGLADAYNVMAAQTYASPASAFPRAKAAALRATALDSGLAASRAALGFIYLFGEWDGDAARRELDAAIRLDPNYASARLYRAFLLAASGHADAAATEMRLARMADPLSRTINARVGFVLNLAHRYDDAIDAERRALSIDSANGLAYWTLGDAFTAKRRFAQAKESFASARRLSGLMLGDEGFALGASGDTTAARAFLAEMNDRARTRFVDPYDRALVFAGLGARDSVLYWLERGRVEHSASLIFIRTEPMFDGLRSDPRFSALVRAIGL